VIWRIGISIPDRDLPRTDTSVQVFGRSPMKFMSLLKVYGTQ